jgi:phosphonate degradation associated HDIG domain protein
MGTPAANVVLKVFGLYEKYGSEEYIGEPVSQLEHMSQSAQFAMDAGFDDEVILAAFFHDIGHICVMKGWDNNMEEFGTKSHEKIGADFLRENGFPEKIAALVENHVQAKRYLTFKYPEYYNQLSDASKKTLEYQGGKMTENEAIQFQKDPLFEISLLMRKWDEMAKALSIPIIDLEILKQKAKRILLKEMRKSL